MPSRRTRIRPWGGPVLDPFKRQSLLRGPDSLLLFGKGYFPGHSASTLDQATAEEHREAEAAMRVDWAMHGASLTTWWVAAAPEAVDPDPWTRVVPGGPGTRPWAWWRFSCPGGRRNGEAEATALERLGVLAAEERARLRWRK
ncbi:hypothetical protein LRS10_16905 [Phenylobacterium sp. J426]|uniref:hypothetical protein n=1 Tax=Phenylobacterium sp. J426 TaxID=2898439 RepID=UPI0021509937|nr:hypothetical protein [Phenylobacterium sp. J426]MCR5875697.1 hypothetical protein [Phenylobacterium sp. J426]